jgi:predicted dehydrogenase
MGKMHGNVYKLLPNAELVACCDATPSRGEAYGKEFGIPTYADLEEMLSKHDIDIVDICLPTFLHKDFTVRAAKAGKHVFCEKPMAMSLDEADAMTAACKTAGVTLMLGHCIRFWPEYALLKQIVDDKRYGKLISLNLTRLGEFPFWSADNWLADETKSGGGVLDMHIHDTDFALYLLGWPEKIYSTGNVDSRGPSYAFTTLQYPGAVVHLEGGWNLPSQTPFRMTFRAVFENGAAFMDGGPMTLYSNGKEPEVPEFETIAAEGGGNISSLGGYFLELKYFVEKVSAGQAVEIVTPESSRESLKLVLEEIKQIKATSGN